MEFQFLNTVKQNQILFCTAILALLLASCTEKIEINVKDASPRLAIYGYITPDTMQHAVRVSRSSGYFATSKPEGLSGALVSISYKDGIYVLEESPVERGLYLTAPDVYGMEGEEYRLQVQYDYDGDGEKEIYEARSFLPYSAKLDSTAVTHSLLSEDFLQIVVWGRLPEQSSNNFNFRFYVNNILMDDAPRGYTLFQEDYMSGREFQAIPVFQLNQTDEKRKLAKGDLISVQIESLTPEYARFMYNVQQESGGSIPVFSGPPANVETNISCVYPASAKIAISGFFTAYSKNRVSGVAGW